jgi:AraC family transcriptional regulator, regulatory protein of adaptative response / methylated-DNA-[protein]-cysteine methyltransferase
MARTGVRRAHTAATVLDMNHHEALIAAACEALSGDLAPSLTQLAQQAGMSISHFHRLFKQALGLTPKQYALAQREQRLRNTLQHNVSVTDALVAAGYSSSSRFYERSQHVLGMPARRYQRGGEQLDITFAVGQCSLGAILVAQSPAGVCAVSLGDDADALVRELQDRFPQARLIGSDRDFEQRVALVIGMIETPQRDTNLPLDIRGTAFQQRVWQALRRIPTGATVSYSELARLIGQPNAVRAVASACAANQLAVAIPCHRVVRNDGSLSGYRWGVARKQALLKREQKNR